MPNVANLTPARIADWKLIAVKAKPILETVPSFAERITELERFIEEADTLQVRQKELKAQLQDINSRRGKLAFEGEALRARLAALIQAEHGFDSKKLIEFGVKPRQRRSRTKKGSGEQQPPAPGEPTVK